MTTKKKVLFDENDEEEETSSKFKKEDGLSINKRYAEKYETWRGKEELQKLKDKYGDVGDSDDESTDESEDEDAKELTNDVEIEFFKALSLVKSKDKVIYDKEKCKFFEKMASQSKESDGEEQSNGTTKETKKEKKPYQLKDLERDMILDKLKKSENGEAIFEEEEEQKPRKPNKIGYFEEQEEIKKSFKKALGSDDENETITKEDDPDFLKVRVKTKEEKEKEEADYIKWLKGKRNKVDNPDIEQNMKYLHDYWNDPNLNEGERFLRDYILNKRYLEKDESEEDDDDDNDKEDTKQSKPAKASKTNHDQPLDYVDLSEEEKIVENQEEFERKYNFRFEDPDPEFIKSYPRTIADSMRRDKSKRKEQREEYKKRKELEKLKKKEEIKRLKSLKRKEIQEKIDKLKKISGLDDIKLTVEDLEKDFDPDEYDKKMQEAVFNDDYYQVNQITNDDNEDDKPVFTDDDEEDLKYMNWDEWQPVNEEKEQEEEEEEKPKKEKKKKRKREEESDEEPEFEMDCEALNKNKKSLAVNNKSKLSQALLRKKPIFDENEKTFEEYFDEYYKLDCEDVIGDMPCRFKYREVVPNDFGLSMEEIIKAKDTELNQWASLKKVTAYRSTAEEINDLKLFKNRKNQVDYKKKVLASVFASEDDDEEEEKEETNEAEEKPVNGKSKQDDEEKQEANDSQTETANQESIKKKKKKKKNKEEEEKTEEKEVTNHQDEPSSNKHKKNKLDVKHSAENETKSNHIDKHKKKKKNKNILESITDERLLAYGIEPKKFHKKIKYSNTNNNNN